MFSLCSRFTGAYQPDSVYNVVPSIGSSLKTLMIMNLSIYFSLVIGSCSYIFRHSYLTNSYPLGAFPQCQGFSYLCWNLYIDWYVITSELLEFGVSSTGLSV